MTDVPTPAQAEKAALFFDILQEAREAGKGWWSSSQMRQIEVAIEQDKRIARLEAALREIVEHEQTYIGVPKGQPKRDLPCAAIAREALEGKPA